ncbi:hypothetical protein BDF22DRAFT_740047 [Syncephalis plumigaleata]|nr:hypothetical protein BDF22DRAFT_740047 [Syncephalis plumigaleata]
MAITPVCTPAAESAAEAGHIPASIAQTWSTDYTSTLYSASTRATTVSSATSQAMTVRLMTFNGHMHPAYQGHQASRQQRDEQASNAARSKEQHHKQAWNPTPRDSLSRREHPGKPGSRRRKRYDNNHFVEHPCAILSPEDLPAPGYPLNAPGFHFTEHTQIAMSSPDTSVVYSRPEPRPRPARRGLTPGDRSLRQAVRRRRVPQGLVRRVEATILRFLYGQDTRSETWTLLDDDDDDDDETTSEEDDETFSDDSDVGDQAGSMVLVCEEDTNPAMTEIEAIRQSQQSDIDDPLTVTSKRRLVWEASDGKDTREGKRLTFIERRPDTILPVGSTSFYDTLFASSSIASR